MITITIEKTTTREVSVTKNFLKSETPSSVKDQYGDPKTAKEYENIEVKETRTDTSLLLKQNLTDEAEETFNLDAVICAINQIGASK